MSVDMRLLPSQVVASLPIMNSPLCNHDQTNSAVACCYCEFPLPYACARHLQEKHSMAEKGFHHFHLPLYARESISTSEIYRVYRPWLFTLQSAYEVLHESLEDIIRFYEKLESLKLESSPSEAMICFQAQSDLRSLQVAFYAEVENAINETKQTALYKSEFAPQSLAYKIWTYDARDSGSLKLFFGEVKRKHPLQFRFGVKLNSLSHLNQEVALQTDEEVKLAETVSSLLEEIKQLRCALSEAQREVEAARAGLAEIQPLKDALEEARKQVEALRAQLAGMQEAKDSLEEAQKEIAGLTSELCNSAEDLLAPIVRTVLHSLPPFDYSSCNIKTTQPKETKCRKLKDGSVYVGEWMNGTRLGEGKLYHVDGSYSEGYWRNENLHYCGRIIYTNGDYYEGQMMEGVREGEGKFVSTEKKFSYVGQWARDMRNGLGTEVFEEGNIRYIGQFVDNAREGQGEFRWGDGSWYIGGFHNNKIEGRGHYTWIDGREYDGEWLEGLMHGKGCFLQADGACYKGEYKRDKKNGYGVFSWDGNLYEGYWKDGKMHGEGWLTARGIKRKFLFANGVKGEMIKD